MVWKHFQLLSSQQGESFIYWNFSCSLPPGVACESCYFNGRTVSWEELCIESFRGHLLCVSRAKGPPWNNPLIHIHSGSAMRCTEGVWLSVTPTRDYLVVAMDFEGEFLNKSLFLWGRLLIQTRRAFYWKKCAGRYAKHAGTSGGVNQFATDTLLVLLNSAISNFVSSPTANILTRLTTFVKVLFRNNFALSRDITGLFNVSIKIWQSTWSNGAN